MSYETRNVWHAGLRHGREVVLAFAIDRARCVQRATAASASAQGKTLIP